MPSITAPRPTRSRRPLGMSLATAMIVTLAPVAGFTLAPAGATTSTPSASWGDCPTDVTAKGPNGEAPKCTTITVPMDYANPSAGTFNILATGFFPAGTPKGVILGNPGGPGGSALDFWGKDNGTPAEMYRDYALIGLQPRGLKNATSLNCTTALECITQADTAYQNTLTTENVARDMDELRKAMGIDKISYYGVSWGTELGAAYATLFPSNVDKMVLDSNVGPLDQVGGGQLKEARSTLAFERRLYDFFDWAAANNKVIGLGDTPYKVYSAWNSARLIEDPNSWVYNYVPPALREADLPETLRPHAAKVLPDLNTVVQGMSKLDYAARLAAAAKTRELPNTDPTSIPGSPLMVNAQSMMYSRSSWSVYAGQIDTILRPIDVKQLGRVIDISTLSEEAAALVNGLGAISARGGAATGTDAAAALAAIQNRSIKWNGFAGAKDGITRAEPDPKFVQLRDAAQKDLDQAIAAGESASTLRAKRLVVSALTEMGWGAVKPASWSGAGLSTIPLVLQSLKDPATTALGGQTLAEQLGGKLVTVAGGDHGVFRRGETVLDQAVLQYLATGKVDITTASEAPVTATNYLLPIRKLLADNGIVGPTVVGPTIPDTPLNRILSLMGPNVDANSIVPKPTFAAPSTPASSQTSAATKEPAPALAASTTLAGGLPTAASTPDTTTAPVAATAPATSTSNPKSDRPTAAATETVSPTTGTATTGTPTTSTTDTAPSTTDSTPATAGTGAPSTTEKTTTDKTTEKSATTSEAAEKASTADSGSTSGT
ncbi:alpha/beta fold hydrolase [Tsukamurella strandjordii]|uniref:Alpha/beta hydrolase n=1 Tax=Tsukamurella strandjordii TaxID=147577 RepID=A0AA90NGI7_9ACTN|nr:alpha/beta hydrolase [Tsukamurella strandjordii]MDP0398085.1 alpha/beta hydrolase [Tsukamurella strandjordii]